MAGNSKWHGRGLGVAAACLVAGAFAGSVTASSVTGRTAHQEGACIALRMAAAYGYLDERQRRVVMRTLTTVANPDAELFPGGYRGMLRTCDAIAGQSN
jgi:hypothetical protein